MPPPVRDTGQSSAEEHASKDGLKEGDTAPRAERGAASRVASWSEQRRHMAQELRCAALTQPHRVAHGMTDACLVAAISRRGFTVITSADCAMRQRARSCWCCEHTPLRHGWRLARGDSPHNGGAISCNREERDADVWQHERRTGQAFQPRVMRLDTHCGRRDAGNKRRHSRRLLIDPRLCVDDAQAPILAPKR